MILPDGNLLIARVVVSHSPHAEARRFFEANPQIVTCAITELNLVRVLLQLGMLREDVFRVLADIIRKHRGRLVPADLSAEAIAQDVTGHRTTTDAYLARLAEHHGLTVATLDAPFAEKFPALVHLVA
jgi:uncharacterized protein